MFYSLLLESLFYTAHTDGSGDVFNLDAKMATNLKKGTWDVKEEIIDLAQNKGTASNISYFFAVNLLPNILKGYQDVVLDAVLVVIENDCDLGKTTQTKFKKMRKEKAPADFLAEAFILAVCSRKNKVGQLVTVPKKQALTLSTPTTQPDAELRLLTETGGICPDCGHKPLIGNKTDRGVMLYEVIPIYPDIGETFDNKIALCLDCARNYMTAAADDEIRRMGSIKMKLIQYAAVREKLDSMNIEQDIKEVLQMILAKPTSDLSQLSYEALCVADKVKDDAPLVMKIEAYVTAYFLYIGRELLPQLSREERINSDLINAQIKACYQSIKNNGLTQAEIFAALVERLKEWTDKKYDTACEVLVAYYVQSCDVFEVQNNDVS